MGPFPTEATQVSNGTFDTRAALVPAPFGPLVRVDSMPDVTPNSNIPVAVTSASTYLLPFEVAYDDIDFANNPEQVLRLLMDIHGIDGYMFEFESWKLIFDANIAAITNYPDVSDTEFASIFNFLRLLEPLFAMVPRFRRDSVNHEEVVGIPSFTLTDDASTGADVTLIVISGDYDWVVWTSTTTVTTWTPSNVSDVLTNILFAGTGAKSITLHVGGPGGIRRHTETVTVT